MKTSYDGCLKYIELHWSRLTNYLPKDELIHIGLPNKFIMPSEKESIFDKDQFYWDSYFILLGLLVSKRLKLAKGMVDNFLYLYERFGIIPSRNRFFNLGISQPPFLSSMVLEVYNVTLDKIWLKKSVKVIEKELLTYWMDDIKAEKHLVHKGLSRYCDHYITHETAETESGWDMTSRFSEKCLDFLPVDLNSLLFKYEKDLSLMFEILSDKEKSRKYKGLANSRKKKMTSLIWNERKGFFFDYDYKLELQSNFYSLAGFYPLWAGLATRAQASNCRDGLKRFEYEYGLANTQKCQSKEFKQWDFPNAWSNQQWIIIKGLLNYGFRQDAVRIAKKWLDLNKKVFESTGMFWEKYDAVKGTVGRDGRYPTQAGFG